MPTPAKQILALGAVLAAALASPASAGDGPKTRLVDCEAGSCLLVTGRRAHTASTVTINGHAVSVEGARKWRVRLPVETLRKWSVPYARTITVSVIDARMRAESSAEADLPIGLLGHVENLAMLVVRVK
ncbi:hypothetical protein OK349_14595 [Sphingomonas sp. BT-65]|uniref:hypothetical protein n=1 Tax=Sphingomonas sp. BT-65 TaxID=2989821 RepID=UPI0022359E08|nr:hypothetical protein [Sphingomonas sp. BT-65]MCW4462941.1 hypothetical protein [Sphingomonas sp. BT-65]